VKARGKTKLALDRETLVQLDPRALASIHGGDGANLPTMQTGCTGCTNCYPCRP
jgi:hypothetical protein